jgi:hypothetical protein
MRVVILLIAAAFLLLESGGSRKPGPVAEPVPRAEASSTSVPKARVDFDTQLKPIFQSRCMPCHFSGGQMYERLPFDRGETIRKLGTRLFSRIKKEDERQLLEQFLTQSP